MSIFNSKFLLIRRLQEGIFEKIFELFVNMAGLKLTTN